LIALVLASFTVGCQTSRSWENDCPGVYSGVRFYKDQIDSIPPDGKVFFTLDLPLSAIADTLLLPASWWVDRRQPSSGWVVGCRWAK
jgi:uncharacterized protein YceK